MLMNAPEKDIADLVKAGRKHITQHMTINTTNFKRMELLGEMSKKVNSYLLGVAEEKRRAEAEFDSDPQPTLHNKIQPILCNS